MAGSVPVSTFWMLALAAQFLASLALRVGAVSLNS